MFIRVNLDWVGFVSGLLVGLIAGPVLAYIAVGCFSERGKH